MKARKPLQACLLALSALLATPTALHSQPYVFTTAAGTAGSSGTSDGTNSNARFLWPEGVAADTSGNVFVADTSNNSIRQL